MSLLMSVILAITSLSAAPVVKHPPPAHRTWRTVQASAEGLVGSGDSCGGTVSSHVLGLASHYPCGTVVWLHLGRHTVRAVTRDHGPYVAGRSLDLWQATERALGISGDAAWGVRAVRMSVGR